MSRRSKAIADFAAEARTGLVTYLVGADEPLDDQLLRDAIRYWRNGVRPRRPRCFGCKRTFNDEAQAAAFLLSTPTTAPTSASVSGLCDKCWLSFTDAEIERAALRVLRKLMPGARLADAP